MLPRIILTMDTSGNQKCCPFSVIFWACFFLSIFKIFDAVRKTSIHHHTYIPSHKLQDWQSSDSHLAVVWQSSDSRLLVIWQSSGSRLAVIWQSFGSCTYKNVAVYKMKVVSFLFLAKDENWWLASSFGACTVYSFAYFRLLQTSKGPLCNVCTNI